MFVPLFNDLDIIILSVPVNISKDKGGMGSGRVASVFGCFDRKGGRRLGGGNVKIKICVWCPQ